MFWSLWSASCVIRLLTRPTGLATGTSRPNPESWYHAYDEQSITTRPTQSQWYVVAPNVKMEFSTKTSTHTRSCCLGYSFRWSLVMLQSIRCNQANWVNDENLMVTKCFYCPLKRSWPNHFMSNNFWSIEPADWRSTQSSKSQSTFGKRF